LETRRETHPPGIAFDWGFFQLFQDAARDLVVPADALHHPAKDCGEQCVGLCHVEGLVWRFIKHLSQPVHDGPLHMLVRDLGHAAISFLAPRQR